LAFDVASFALSLLTGKASFKTLTPSLAAHGAPAKTTSRHNARGCCRSDCRFHKSMGYRTGAHHRVAKSITTSVESGSSTLPLSVELKQRIE
jgi:hypothetical protein